MRGRSLLVPLLIAAFVPAPPAAATCGGMLGGISGEGNAGAGAQVFRVPWKLLQAGLPEGEILPISQPALAVEVRDDFAFARFLDDPAFVESTRGADSGPGGDHQSDRSGTR